MKGMAILFMLFLHLFNRLENVDLCENILTIGGYPFVYILARAANPVPFFIILSGYGLYISHHKGTYNVLKKLRGLYLHYWITLLIFVTLGFFIAKDVYPGSVVDIINNVTAWNTTYNGEMWFLFPYVMIMLTSKWIVKVLDRFNPWLCLGVTFFLSLCTGYVISRYGTQYLYGNQLLYKPVLYVQFLFPFTLGAYMAKFRKKLFDDLWGKDKNMIGGGKHEGGECTKCYLKLKYQLLNKILPGLLLISLVVFRCCFETSAFHVLYAAAFLFIFVKSPRPKTMNTFLLEMGKRSTSMWFVHSWFCYYLFHDWIYSFHYPLVIFSVLLACSYASAVVIDLINEKIRVLLNL